MSELTHDAAPRRSFWGVVGFFVLAVLAVLVGLYF